MGFSHSRSNIRPFHYFEVEIELLMLDRLSELPAGPSSYSSWREMLCLSRYPATNTLSGPSPPSPTSHTLTLGMILACGLSKCLGACVAKAAPPAVKPPVSKLQTWCRRGLSCLPLAPLLMKIQGETKKTQGYMQINTCTVSQQYKFLSISSCSFHQFNIMFSQPLAVQHLSAFKQSESSYQLDCSTSSLCHWTSVCNFC